LSLHLIKGAFDFPLSSLLRYSLFPESRFIYQCDLADARWKFVYKADSTTWESLEPSPDHRFLALGDEQGCITLIDLAYKAKVISLHCFPILRIDELYDPTIGMTDFKMASSQWKSKIHSLGN